MTASIKHVIGEIKLFMAKGHYKYRNSFSAGTVFIRQNLPSNRAGDEPSSSCVMAKGHYKYRNSFSAGTVFIRQNLPSTDGRF